MLELRDYVQYYKAYKQLRALHVKLEFGSHPSLPSGFTERLCRLLYGLEECNGREFDATKDEKLFEIKATGVFDGATTINLKAIRNAGKRFGGIYWVYLVDERDEFHVVQIAPEALKKRLGAIDEMKPREPIRLRNFPFQIHDIYEFDFEAGTLEKAVAPP